MAGFLTNSGLAKLAVATPLTPMTVKYMAFDKGQGTPSPTMTALFDEAYRTEIPNPVKDPAQPKNLTFSGFVPTDVGGWTIYGIGLFDSLNVLVAYLQLAEPVVKSDPSSALKMSWQQDFIIALANAGDTDLIVTDSIQFRHDALTNRNLADSHPIAAITGLQSVLDQKTTDLTAAVADIDADISAIITDRNSTRATKNISADYTVLPADSGVIKVDASAGNITITMAKSTDHITKELLIVRTDSSANIVTISPAAGDSFYGEGFAWSLAIIKQYETFIFKASVDAWYGVRGLVSSISKEPTTGQFNLVHKGDIVDQFVLMGDVATTAKKGVSQLATAAEVAAGTDSSKTITPKALRDSASATLAAIGTHILPSGLIEKWGYVARGSTAANTEVTLTFASAFPNNCFNIQTTIKDSALGTGSDAQVHILTLSKTAATYHYQLYNQDAGMATVEGFYWRAIGN